MPIVSRNHIIERDERGPTWFDEFLRTFSTNTNTISKESVIDVVSRYQEQSGLNLITSGQLLKEASSLGPISPMKLKKIKNPDDMLKDFDDSELIIQIKLDGFKTQAIKNNDVKVYTRRGEEYSDNVPELIKELDKLMPANSFVLGELVWEDKQGRQSISDIQTVVGSNPDKAYEKIKSGEGKVIFYVYDLLWNKGKDITKTPYTERYNALKSIVKNAGSVKLVKNFTYSQKDEVINSALKVNAEGIVIKPKQSHYEYGKAGSGEQVGSWAKFKPGAKAQTDEVILNKYSKGEDKLVFPMYQYKGSELFEVGKLSGMSKEDESKIKKQIDVGKSVVVEITFQDRMPSGKFRHVGWSRFRFDKSAKEVKYSKAFISIRQAYNQDIISIIESKPDIVSAIQSLCRHSGGHKNTHAIIRFLRNKLGHELIQYSDQDLIKYIEKIKNEFKSDTNQEHVDVGLIGLDNTNDFQDNAADYINHGAK